MLVWSALLTVLILLIGLGLGTVIALPPVSSQVFWQGGARMALTAGLTVALVTPITFFASAGRGYLSPLGMAFLVVILAQVVAATGWGEYFPGPYRPYTPGSPAANRHSSAESVLPWSYSLD